MRRLSSEFMDALRDSGMLAPLVHEVASDKDLDLHIRDDYVNIYYKGNALLKLSRKQGSYRVDIHSKFRTGLEVPTTLDRHTLPVFLAQIPALKVNIIRYGSASLEIEYEQLIIRANNDEPRNNSEYFILDRQYALKNHRYRFDLIGFHWGWRGRRRDQEVPLCLMEIKFALNNDIQNVHNQLEVYYDLIKDSVPQLASEYQTMLHQKCELGLLPRSQIAALQTLKISSDIKLMRFIVILVDYNPFSSYFDDSKLKTLPFASQVWLFRTGFGMWDTSPALGVTPLGSSV